MAVSLNDLKNIELKQINRAAPVVLLLLILYLCWKLAALFWLLIAPPQAMQLDRVELGSQQAQIPNISAFSLFQEVGQSAGVVETANIILQGVVVASPSYNSSAVLKINDQVDRYRVGEMLANSGFELAEVYWDRVILRRSTGATQEVLFKGLENGLNQPIVPETSVSSSSMPAMPSNSGMPEQPSPQNEIGRAIQQMQENKDQYLQNMGVSAADGSYEVTSRTPAALRNRLGLRPGDRILSLNGQTLSQGQTEAQLLEQARREGQVKLEIKRGDQVMTIQQDLK
ncbi:MULTISPECIES: type II secretion system protein N [Acinetobacter]|jgi:general secretion pathway protein C|uniref:type II secretion system protein N n=1 Tax=Acinetobacter TaxID=469 RepID=UPI001449A528|nr:MULTISPECIES: type II secretion system protein N [Acinetobacter]MCO8086399.1 PDZ domain-containing protein [Acinetobacter lwoffii]MCO8113887.1 PDZ domain-containing protein [Acinetobacter lwoffii]MCU4421572.1 PDZ domain-containing protein [Acinetobacter lwoffii]QJB47552.1 PDZ domain-containing protein [Acinetobacter sp. NEB149]